MTDYPDNRDVLGDWLNRQRLATHFVEVGCAFGGFARLVLSQWRGTHYYMVDRWEKQDPEIYRESTNETAPFDLWYKQCQELEDQDPRVRLFRGDSVDASEVINNGKMDCVYIDANHDLLPVLTDLKAWWPKVKPGGLFGGHDFMDNTKDGHHCMVKTAVEIWSQQNNVQFHVTPCSSWWVRKAE